jgi:hypothetical protein
MKILGLNCQGVGNAPTVRALLNVQRHYNLEVMFLSGMHLDKYPAECLRRRLKMNFKIINPSNGRSGGLIIFWESEVVIEQKKLAPKYIDVLVKESPTKI